MNNFVAKHCRTFNKATVQRDRTKFKREAFSLADIEDEWLDEEVLSEDEVIFLEIEEDEDLLASRRVNQ